MSKWQAEKAERNRQSLARLNRALPRVFPPAVLSWALGRPFVPPTPRLAVDSYWRAHPIRADRLARALAARSGARDWSWKLGDNRLRWTCVVPALTPAEAAPQIRFAKEHGAVGVCIRPFERGRLMTDPFYYPIFDEAERLDIPVTVHIANGNPDLFDLMNNEVCGGFSTFRIPTVTACYALIMSEIPRVFKKLRWGFIETSSQWVPWVVHEAVRRSLGGQHPISTNCFH